MGISKAIRVFESPLLCIWQFECSVHIFRGPWVSWHKQADTRKLTQASLRKPKGRNFKTGKFKTKSDRWVITESSLRHPWVIPGSSLGHPWVIPESCTTMGIREKLEFEVFKVIYYSHSGRFLNIFNQNFKKSIMDFENFKKFQIRLTLLHSDAFWLFLVHWGLDKPLLKIQGGHIK